jgi:hypothetical protein
LADLPRYLTPPQLAELWGCKPEKILGFIRRGQLRAFDLSEHPGVGRPRWRISAAAVAEFEANRAAIVPPKRTRRKRDPAVLDIIR